MTNIKEKYKSLIAFTNCEPEAEIYDKIIKQLEADELKNVAILGQPGSGKTTLINLLSSRELIPVTSIRADEKKYMVTFDSGAERDGFIKINVTDGPEENKGIALYEMPVEAAIDFEKGVCTPELEAMDAVIYVMSALMPTTASDVDILRNVVNRFPLMVYISKTDLLDSTEDCEECREFVRGVFREAFEDTCCDFFDSGMQDAGKEMISRLSQMSVEEIRWLRISQLEYSAKAIITEKLRRMLDAVSEKRARRNLQAVEAEERLRENSLGWSSLRLSMLEKQQQTAEMAEKKISAAKDAAKQALVKSLYDSKKEKIWLKNSLRPMLEAEIKKTAGEVATDVTDMSQLHASWLLSELSRRFDKQLLIGNMHQHTIGISSNVKDFKGNPDLKNMFLSIGTSWVIGTTFVSGLSVAATASIVIPAAVLTAFFAKGLYDDQLSFRKQIAEFVEETCEDNFSRLIKTVRSDISNHYSKIVSDIISMSQERAEVVNFDDIDAEEKEIRDRLDEISGM